MIYLIDDNQDNQRLKFYNISFVEEGVFDGYLTSIEKIEKKNDLKDISHLEFLKSSDCILLHSTTEDYDKEKESFCGGSNINSINIKEIIAQEGEKIPLVLFSNRMGEAEYDYERNPNYIPSIKKNFFYERLFDFLEFYKETGKVELRMLAWGKNFASKEISRLAFNILSSLELKNMHENLVLSDLSKVLRDFSLFIELSLPNNDFNAILNELEDNPITTHEFKRKINLITESFTKYGKNIHSW